MDTGSPLVTWLIHPLITLVVISAIVLGTFEVLGGLISKAAFVFDWVSRILHPLVWIWNRVVPYPEANSRTAQCAIGGGFFCYFIWRLPTSKTWQNFSYLDKTIAFSYVVVLVLVLAGLGFWMARHYRRHYSQTLFYHRKVKPVWDWVSFQSYALLWLDRIPILRPVIGALDEVAKRVHHRRWQVFLRCLFALSLFTLPVQMLPEQFYDQSKAFIIAPFDRVPIFKEVIETWIEKSEWLGVPAAVFGAIYFYLIDWMLTVLLLYFAVSALAPLEPRNLFRTVDEALHYFVEERKIFIFACYFWQDKDGGYAAAFYPKIGAAQWEATARVLHREMLHLDQFLISTYQGINARIAAVFDQYGLGNKSVSTECIHYRRFGRSAFLVAVDEQARQFDGTNIKSQTNFLQLSESIGSLVNVRHSLKYSNSHLESATLR